MNKVSIKIEGVVKSYKKGITLEQLAKEYQVSRKAKIVAAKVNNIMRELTTYVEEDSLIEFIDLSMADGIRIYVRSLTFVFIRACREVCGSCSIVVEHSLNKGLYCEVKGGFTLTPNIVAKIENKMKEIVSLDDPFIRMQVSLDEAEKVFKDMGFYDKIDTLKYRPEDFVNLYKCGWMKDYLYGYMVPSTSYIDIFKLDYYLPGVILKFPHKESPDRLSNPIDSPKLSRVFKLSEDWGRLINVINTAQLNNMIESGKSGDLIRMCEAYHENQIAEIAENIARHNDRIHLILIAGPSSSGKTTFAQRLRVQLLVHGLNPYPLSIDDYYIDRDKVPADENGEVDLESLDTIDIELFNEQLSALIQGQEVEMPHFNFEKGIREYDGKKVKIDNNQPIIVEGIHGLNERLTQMIPSINKYKIYISALTQLNLDNHNRIPTTDTRIIRRIVRDHRTRGTSVEETLKMWDSVRRGEENNIFPYQEQADKMFNSALAYELSVLKPHVEMLLRSVKKKSKHYPEANRLLKFIKYFVPLDCKEIPNNSIIREFIGKGCFGI